MASPSPSPSVKAQAGIGGNNPRTTLLIDKHRSYIKSLDKDTQSLDYMMTEHLRMSGVYWGLTTMNILGSLGEMDEKKVIDWVLKCQHPCGGFGGNVDHDPHILYTLSAIQILALYDKLHLLDADQIAACIHFDILPRFRLLPTFQDSSLPTDRLLAMNGEKLTQVFCCVGALAIAGALHYVDADLLGWWLCERQVKSGGLNGRPEKLPDVCYSWWVLSSLVILDRVHWLDKDRLKAFILSCQDEERGGISDRPDDMVDVFHTFFGVAGLSLLEYPGLKHIDPAYALPVEVVQRVLSRQRQTPA